jgi:hypothetical protein
MGTLGTYLSGAREAKGIDLHDAAQQTRISVNYLRAMEEEDFSKLPGEVFVKGFLKNYARFLSLEETEVIRRYQEMKPPKQPQAVAPEPRAEMKTPAVAPAGKREIPIEPLVWGAVIFIILVVLLFVSLPERTRHDGPEAPPAPAESNKVAGGQQASKPEKLYLEIVALEDVWILVRTDASPQKKAVLKKGENVIWSADGQFLLSYGVAGGAKLLLNGNELTVKAPRNAVVRDLVITASGIVTQKIQEEQKPRPVKPQPHTQPPQALPPAAEAPPAPAPQPPPQDAPAEPAASPLPVE